MKSTLFKTLAIIMGMMMSFSLVSCGDDDDKNEPENPKAVSYYAVKYAIELNEDWFKFFDITATYVTDAGEEKTETVDKNNVVFAKIEANKAPKTISFKIHVTRKASIPTVDPDQPYHFTGTAQLLVQEYLKDNTTGQWGGNLYPVGTHGNTIGGKDMEKFMDKYNNTDIYDYSVVLSTLNGQ